MNNPRVPDEEDARFVPVADRPANEVGMRLAPKRSFHYIFDEKQGGRMRGVLKRVENCGAIAVRQI